MPPHKDGQNDGGPGADSRQGTVYRLTVEGHLNGSWSEWLGGLLVTHQPDGTTALTGPVVDQAALYGLLLKMRDLGLALLSVQRVDDESATRVGRGKP